MEIISVVVKWDGIAARVEWTIHPGAHVVGLVAIAGRSAVDLEEDLGTPEGATEIDFLLKSAVSAVMEEVRGAWAEEPLSLFD